jgi:microcin C transport system substrate-binding protein
MPSMNKATTRSARRQAAPAVLLLLLAAALAFAPGAGAFDLPEGAEWTTNMDDPPLGDPAAIKGGTIRISMDAYPLTFRLMGPNSNDAFASWNRAYAMDFALTIRHPTTDNFIPWMCTHWAIHKDSNGDGKEDNRVVYYKLDPDARWSDGKPVTADDYVFTYEMMGNPVIADPFYKNYRDTWFEKVEALDEHTVRIVGKEDSWKPLAQYTIWPTPRHVTDLTETKDLKWPDRVVYDPQVVPGPYVVDPKQNVEGQQIVFAKVPNWWGTNKHYMLGMYNPDRVVLKVIPTERNLDYFRSHEIDFYTENTARIWAEETRFDAVLKGWAHRKLAYTDTPSGVYGIHMNLNFPLFKNKDFRKGLQYMMDFDKLNETLMFGAYRRQVTIFPGTEYENKDLKPYGFEPKKANEHFTKAGFAKRGTDGIRVNDKGERASFTLIYGSKGLERHLTVIQDDLKKMGVEMKLSNLESGTAFSRTLQRKFEAIVSSRTGNFYPDPEQYFHSKFARDAKGEEVLDTNNMWCFGTPETDKLIDTYKYDMDKQARLDAMRKLEEIIQDEAFYLPFWDAPYIRFLHWDDVCRDAGHRGRIRLRQVGDRPFDHAAWCRNPPGRIAAGEIRLEGRDLLDLPESRHARRARQRHRDDLPGADDVAEPGLTVGDQIAEALQLHRAGAAEAARRAAIEMLECWSDPRAPRSASTSIRTSCPAACAARDDRHGAACDPKLLIADEPTTALDVTIQAQILDLMRRPAARARHAAIMFITHDLGVVAELAHRVAVMYAGKHRRGSAGRRLLFAEPRIPTRSAPGLDPALGNEGDERGSPPSKASSPIHATPAGRLPLRARAALADEKCQAEQPPASRIARPRRSPPAGRREIRSKQSDSPAEARMTSAEPLLSVTATAPSISRSARLVFQSARHRHRARRRRRHLRRGAGRDARARRRVGLRQVDDGRSSCA